MPAAAFAQLVSQLMEAMGQSMASVREVPEGMLVKTSDGFLYAFVEDANQVSLGFVQRLGLEVGSEGARLVLFSPGRLPLALSAEVLRRRGSVVDSGRFRELAQGLGLGALVGEEPRPDAPPKKDRLLPSARQLDEIMGRARTWGEWGVPALSLRFYRQAADHKPEYLPARNGIGHALLALGLPAESERAYDEVLTLDPANLDARIGKASVLGATGRIPEEIAAYRGLLSEDPSRFNVRAQLVAVLIDAKEWGSARTELEAMIGVAPDNGRLRYLHAAALEHTGEASAAKRERERARALGLPFEREQQLAQALGLPPLSAPEVARTPTPARAKPAPKVAAIPAKPAPASAAAGSRSATPRPPTSSARPRTRKPKKRRTR
ncbi:MAG TPA: tetratricopeptide repeat protein [Thermoplasmata archaeon]|nr:tetratricopeptide repeat protein [Thermoplasmata archaeon]